jgi:hypothetical protein
MPKGSLNVNIIVNTVCCAGQNVADTPHAPIVATCPFGPPAVVAWGQEYDGPADRMDQVDGICDFCNDRVDYTPAQRHPAMARKKSHAGWRPLENPRIMIPVAAKVPANA